MRTTTAQGLWSGMRSPRFQRDPFVRDMVCDHGRAPAPRVVGPLILPSTFPTASAIAFLSRLNTYPTRSLCTLRQPPSPTATQHSLPGAPLRLARAGLPPAEPASFAWRTGNESVFAGFTAGLRRESASGIGSENSGFRRRRQLSPSWPLDRGFHQTFERLPIAEEAGRDPQLANDPENPADARPLFDGARNKVAARRDPNGSRAPTLPAVRSPSHLDRRVLRTRTKPRSVCARPIGRAKSPRCPRP